jgi:hypothetical protein
VSNPEAKNKIKVNESNVMKFLNLKQMNKLGDGWTKNEKLNYLRSIYLTTAKIIKTKKILEFSMSRV